MHPHPQVPQLLVSLQRLLKASEAVVPLPLVRLPAEQMSSLPTASEFLSPLIPVIICSRSSRKPGLADL